MVTTVISLVSELFFPGYRSSHFLWVWPVLLSGTRIKLGTRQSILVFVTQLPAQMIHFLVD